MSKTTKTAKVLLVDDSNKALQQEKNLLERTGVQVTTALTGPEAIKLVYTDKPDIMFLDLMLPEMGGDAVCRFIKSNPRLADISVIIVTARTEEEVMQRLFQCGCDAYVTKPFKPEELLRKLKVVLDEKEIYLNWDKLLDH